jgi:hypothetical protein
MTPVRRLAGVTAALAACAAGGFLASTPAQAAEAAPAHDGCTISMRTPQVVGHYADGTKKVRYSVAAHCTAGHTIVIEDRRLEYDRIGHNDDTGFGAKALRFRTEGTVVVWWDARLPNTERGNEEVFHRARFKVTADGVTGEWSDWQRSKIASIAN